MRRALIGAVVAAVLGAGCSGGSPPRAGDGGVAGASPAPDPRCDAPSVPLPEGFMLVGSAERAASGGPRVHRTYRDESGIRLDLLLGVEGEVGEGLPLRGQVDLASGVQGRLLGRARTWILAWEEPPPCGQTALIVNGIGRRSFRRLVAGTGLLAAAP